MLFMLDFISPTLIKKKKITWHMAEEVQLNRLSSTTSVHMR